MCSASTCSLKLPSRIEWMYNKTFIWRSVTQFHYRIDVLSFNICVSQSCCDKSVSLTDTASRSLIKSSHRVICNVYLAPFMLFTSLTAKSPVMENLLSVRICTSPEPSINCPWISNKNCSIWSRLKMNKYWEKISGWQNWSSLVWDWRKLLTFIIGCSKQNYWWTSKLVPW